MSIAITEVKLRRHFLTLVRHGIAAAHFPAYSLPQRTRSFRHDTLYGSLLLSGRVRHWVAEESSEEGPGVLCVVASGVAHSIVTLDGPVEVINLYLDPERHMLPELPPILSTQLHRLLPIHPGLLHRGNRLTRITLDAPERIAGWLHTLMREQAAPADDPGAALAIPALAQLVLLDLARAVASREPSADFGRDDPLMERLRLRLDADFAEPLRMTDLAAELELSAEHCARRFRRYAGKPPAAYLHQRRLAEAMRLLRLDDRRILDLALEAGFSDLAHFNRSFRAVAGCTPRDYRRRFRSG